MIPGRPPTSVVRSTEQPNVLPREVASKGLAVAGLGGFDDDRPE